MTTEGESMKWAVKVTCKASAIRGKRERDASEQEIVSIQEMVIYKDKKKKKMELKKGEENKALI